MTKLAVKYLIFALIATAFNLGAQRIIDFIYTGKFSFYISMLIGTLIGLFVKYLLDKKWIFYYKTKSVNDDFYKFILYSFMGVFTTLIFWGFEWTFNFMFSFYGAKYVGGFIGLCIGYYIKYNLDKKYVFAN